MSNDDMPPLTRRQMRERNQAPQRRSLRQTAPPPSAPSAPSSEGTSLTGKAGRRRRYPRPDKGPIMRWLPSWKFVLGLFVSAIIVAIGLFALAYSLVKVPKPGDFAQAQTSTVYFADAATSLGTYSEFDRKSMKLADLPPHVAHAVVASEDRRFYTNPGIDIKGIARAMWNNVRGKPLQGASTLTQQYVERYYTGTTKDVVGKAKEAILALKIDRQQSKEEILENYLNTIYFGRGAYGIEVAAHNYFGKSAAELSLSESALLAGLIPAPSKWDPAVMPERAQERWARVLDLMVTDGWITADERATQTFPETIDYQPKNALKGPRGYIVDMVRAETIDKAGISEDELSRAGLTIVTTIPEERQAAAEKAVEELPADRPANNRLGLVSMDPRTGAIQAIYGGPDFVEQPRNAVTQDRAQAGSTFKIWALIASLENGGSLYDSFDSYTNMDVPGFDKPVRNYDSRDRGRINMVRATQDSVNTPYAQLNVEVGPDKTMQAAVRAGIPEDTPGLQPVPANVLGPASLRPYDQLRAYGTIASGGVKHEPHLVAEIKDAQGRTIYRAEDKGEEIFKPEVIADTTFALQQVTKAGTAHYVGENLGRPAAGKTGSSNDYKSAWFAGFTPQLVTVVDMYQVGPNGEEEELTPFGGVKPIAGGTFPTRVWTSYMKAALEGQEVLPFPEPTVKKPIHRPAPAPAPTQEETTPPAEPAPAPSDITPGPTIPPIPQPTDGKITPPPRGPHPGQPTIPPPRDKPKDEAGAASWFDWFAAS